jgi:hypothetical protein
VPSAAIGQRLLELGHTAYLSILILQADWFAHAAGFNLVQPVNEPEVIPMIAVPAIGDMFYGPIVAYATSLIAAGGIAMQFPALVRNSPKQPNRRPFRRNRCRAGIIPVSL